MSIILVTGAARSGKSEFAENIAKNQKNPVIYIATAQDYPEDIQWQARIEAHRLRRPQHWQIRHCPLHLNTILANSLSEHCLLIDSLGTWVANLLTQNDETWDETVVALLNILNIVKDKPIILIFVAEETGWGIIPSYESGRCFRDRLGYLTRQIGTLSDTVYLVVGGYALNLSQLGQKF